MAARTSTLWIRNSVMMRSMDSPAAKTPRTTSTSTRVPAITGLPAWTRSSRTIRPQSASWTYPPEAHSCNTYHPRQRPSKYRIPPPARAAAILLELLVEPQRAQRQEQDREHPEHRDLGPQLGDADALQEDAADDLEKVGEREQESDLAGDHRHALARKHVTGEQDVRDHEEGRGLHGLCLGGDEGRDEEPDREV